jgi:hypothetical protein
MVAKGRHDMTPIQDPDRAKLAAATARATEATARRQRAEAAFEEKPTRATLAAFEAASRADETAWIELRGTVEAMPLPDDKRRALMDGLRDLLSPCGAISGAALARAH